MAKPKSFTWNGVTYPSLRRASKITGMSQTTVIKYHKAGYTCEKDVKSHSAGCSWNGQVYSTIAAAAEAEGITQPAMSYRIAMGYTCDADLYNIDND